MRKMFLLSGLLLAMVTSCKKEEEPIPSVSFEFGEPQLVTLVGYSGISMEPFLSRDGTILFFNNSNDPTVNTNLHYASKIDNLKFKYEGELQGVNTSDLEGVPSMDEANTFYFVSTRTYFQNFSSLFKGTYSNGVVSNVEPLPGLSKNQAGWLNFDAEISADGNELYTVDGRYDENGGPYESDFVLAKKKNNVFSRVADNTFEKINTAALEYAACISADGLEFYFTRVATPFSSTSITQLYMATRESTDKPFSTPIHLTSATGFVEAPTISPDNQTIYYHKRVNSSFAIYCITKVGPK